MRRIILIPIIIIACFACSNDDDDDDYGDIDFKDEMRNFVIEISQYSKAINPNFIIIPQNGQELTSLNGEVDNAPHYNYLDAIDGVGREDLFYGYDNDDVETSATDRNYMMSFLDICVDNDVAVLVTDYCWTQSKIDNSFTQNNTKGYISFAAPNRELDVIPDYPALPYNVNTNNISSLSEANNFLYLLNPDNFESRDAFVDAIAQTNYDAIIMDFFFNEEEFTSTQINALKTKANGGNRLVISYMSIGEAEDYRYYWNSTWSSNPPSWVEKENPDWEGNYKVRYWDTSWKAIIFGNNDSYLKKIIDAGFDGVYLDIIDAFEYFEK